MMEERCPRHGVPYCPRYGVCPAVTVCECPTCTEGRRKIDAEKGWTI